MRPLTGQRKENHQYKLKIRAIARLWVKWNRKELGGDEFPYEIAKLLPKETRQAWERSIGIFNDKLFSDKEVKSLEDLLV